MTIAHSDFASISALDLEPIKVKLMHEESGEGWTRERADTVELQYRRFLILMKKYPNEAAAPQVDVDIFWHYHILDTMKYAHDCQCVFGYFLHHYPYLGLGEDEEEVLERAGERMRDLYEATFAEPYGNTLAAGSESAYCVLTSQHISGRPRTKRAPSIDTAYCVIDSRATGAARPNAAYCVKALPHTAYCVITAQPAAYCVVQGQPAAYCVVAQQHAAPGTSRAETLHA